VRFRPLTVALMAAWAVLSLVAALQALAPDLWVVAALCLIAGYFLVIGLLPSRAAPT